MPAIESSYLTSAPDSQRARSRFRYHSSRRRSPGAESIPVSSSQAVRLANAIDWRGKSVLMHASARNHAEMAKLLIEQKARVDAADEYGRTALFLAAAAGQDVRRLLAAGADPTRPAHGGWTPFHFFAVDAPAPPSWRRWIARDPPPPTVLV